MTTAAMSTMKKENFLEELTWRGLLHQRTAEAALDAHLATPGPPGPPGPPATPGTPTAAGRIGYCGFDPTADSLTIGNFVPIKLLMHWQRAGHTPIVVMGGGTGLIGDPSGKDAERTLMTREQVEANVAGQRRVYEAVLDFDGPNAARIVNNLDWLDELKFLEVLRDVGKHFSVNAMIQKDSVRTRLEQREHGISYTEFSYMILQAYDFLHLRRAMNCTVQIAGSDQYGNIVAGIDLIHREFGHDADAYGVTAPLVTTADGKKIGKTEKGAIWLTADRTSPFAFYQYWINVSDDDVVQFLKWFTFLGREEIEALAAEHERVPHERPAHRALAQEMTRLIHGEAALQSVERATEALFTGDVRSLDASMLAEVFADVPSTVHDKAALEGEGVLLVELLPQTSLASSKREARQFLTSGAVAVNGERVGDGDAALERRLTTADLLHGETILLRRGKKKWHATRWR